MNVIISGKRGSGRTVLCHFIMRRIPECAYMSTGSLWAFAKYVCYSDETSLIVVDDPKRAPAEVFETLSPYASRILVATTLNDVSGEHVSDVAIEVMHGAARFVKCRADIEIPLRGIAFQDAAAFVVQAFQKLGGAL